jgi:uroporphyrinogen-III synthase
MHLLLTRPHQDAEPMRAALEAAGHVVAVEPLLEIELLPVPVAVVAATDALVLTSRNGVRALLAAPAETRAAAATRAVLAVGPGTAALLREAGFDRVVEGPGEASALPALATAVLPAGARIVHLSGAEVAVDLVPPLRARGFDCRREIVYKAMTAAHFSDALQQMLREQRLEGVLLMSPRTAEAWAENVERAGLGAEVRRIVHFCLSARVAAKLSALDPTLVEVAAVPTAAALTLLVEMHVQGR